MFHLPGIQGVTWDRINPLNDVFGSYILKHLIALAATTDSAKFEGDIPFTVAVTSSAVSGGLRSYRSLSGMKEVNGV